ncbi:hypothetical protein GGR28_000973 [Lewinella aquimaris]|uniref:Uncharacterized protein n=1 Tax=Neolewinella aquimaris TaxID=1835722 RepID=A0A840DZM4_9BACT|nr:hypothetical protein [Neolewinella aquimaris]MBB4078360.1 hypothetical protein [Neolewinella aquimaris]
MMRVLLLFLLLYVSSLATAQLRVGGAAGAMNIETEPVLLVRPLLLVDDPKTLLSPSLPGTRDPAAFAIDSNAPRFDFASAKPYLAFFCRFELHIEEATRFPVRFRLGEVRTWQQELTKRD